MVIIDETLRSEIASTLSAAAEYYGFEAVYLGDDIEMIEPHPTVLGMKEIERAIREVMFAEN